jgi:Ca-activated chloride channel family protein
MEYLQEWHKIHLEEPLWLLLLLFIPIILWIQKKGNMKDSTLLFPELSRIKKSLPNKKDYSQVILKSLRCFSLVFLTLALARPQFDRSTSSVVSSGVDIVLAIDLSASMLALDMSEDQKAEITRLDVVKGVIKDFVSKRKHDRIGLVAFSVDPYLVSALTLDKEHLQKNIDRLRVGLTHQTGTNIGSALAEGINRLRTLESKSKILILLTDGKDEPPPPHSPLIYAEGAKNDNIKIYTIAVGTATRTRTYLFDQRSRDLMRYGNGNPVVQVADYPVDKEILRKISTTTNAHFYEAKNKSELSSIYNEIDRLEKTEVELNVNMIFEELFQWPLALSLVLIFLEFILAKTIFLRIP